MGCGFDEVRFDEVRLDELMPDEAGLGGGCGVGCLS